MHASHYDEMLFMGCKSIANNRKQFGSHQLGKVYCSKFKSKDLAL